MLFLFFTFYCTVWHVGSLNLSSPALEAQSLNHWTKREVPGIFCGDSLRAEMKPPPRETLGFFLPGSLGSLRVQYHRRLSISAYGCLAHACYENWPVFTCLFSVKTSQPVPWVISVLWGVALGLSWCTGSVVVAQVGSAAPWLVGPSSPDQRSKPHRRQ